MTEFKRYAIYYAPEPGPLAEFAAAWLGWDPATGQAVAHPDVPGLEDIAALTATPRKYGFHGTVKPPFRLAEGETEGGLQDALANYCVLRPGFDLDGLRLARLGGFLALVPTGDTTPLADLAASTVRAFDRFRAPAGEAEMARRRSAGLSAKQDAYLVQWGYPYVMDEFRFHLTLTGRLEDVTAERIETALRPVMAPLLPAPFTISSLCLFGENADNMFHLIHRYALSG